MGAAKANNNRDTYRATAVTLIVFGILYLVDKLIHFSSIGLPWVMNKDNFLLYTAVIFLIFKRDKSVGLVLIGLWLILNFGLITALLGTMSAYLLPVTLLVLGIILYWLCTRYAGSLYRCRKPRNEPGQGFISKWFSYSTGLQPYKRGCMCLGSSDRGGIYD